MEIIFALITSVAFAFDAYFIRKGLIEAPYPIVAAFISLTINIIFFTLLSLIYIPTGLLKLNLIYFFIIAGILAPGFARLFAYRSFETLGMAITTPIVNAELIFAVILALIFLKEPMNLFLGIGILSVLMGILFLGYETGQRGKKNISKQFQYRYLFFPIMASLFYGISVFIRKVGLNMVNSPILGATFTSGTSWLIVLIFLLTSGNYKRLFQIRKQSFAYFSMAGGATCIAWFSVFHALNIGNVVIVTPIASSYSLVTLFLSYLLLRDTERINMKIILSTILIVGGIIVLSIAR